ncbi:MAG: tRNA (adenine-N1)-methyltransferase [Anaerolineales bacterium]
MATNVKQTIVQPGDIAQLIDSRGNQHIVQLNPNGNLQTHLGQINFEDLFGLYWGSHIKTHTGKNFLLLQPSLHDILINIRRSGTIMYPKDMGYIILNMNIVRGTRIIEAGSGSGAFTTALAVTVGPEGHVYSYDNREDIQSLARKNLEKLGLTDRVTFTSQDIGYGFNESAVDALFLDLSNPEDYTEVARNALKPGGFFGSILPTTNQVSRLLEALNAHNFSFIEVCEIIQRYYKPVPARLRPDDRLTAHTGFLIFGRPMLYTGKGSFLNKFPDVINS